MAGSVTLANLIVYAHYDRNVQPLKEPGKRSRGTFTGSPKLNGVLTYQAA